MEKKSNNELIDQKINGADALGKDPKTGMPIYVLTGRYGPYVQLGDNENEKDPELKPKRTSIPPHIPMDTVDMEKALLFLSLPKTLGQHPDTQKDIKLGIGRFGPYIVCDGDYRSIPKTEDFFAVDLKKALEMLAQPKKGRGGRGSSVVKELGEHGGDKLQIMTGKYGPYIKWGKKNVSLPEGQKPEDFTMEKAIELLGAQPDEGGKKAKKAAKKAVPTKVDLKVTKVIAKGASKKAKASKAPAIAKLNPKIKSKAQKRT